MRGAAKSVRFQFAVLSSGLLEQLVCSKVVIFFFSPLYAMHLHINRVMFLIIPTLNSAKCLRCICFIYPLPQEHNNCNLHKKSLQNMMFCTQTTLQYCTCRRYPGNSSGVNKVQGEDSGQNIFTVNCTLQRQSIFTDQEATAQF